MKIHMEYFYGVVWEFKLKHKKKKKKKKDTRKFLARVRECNQCRFNIDIKIPIWDYNTNIVYTTI